ncbi:MAG: hypothetical protein ACK53Y_21690, partial [bacterium]
MPRASRQEALPGYRQDFIGEIRSPPDQFGGGCPGPKALDQLGLVCLDAVTEHCTRTGINAECSIDTNVPVVRVNRHVSRKPKISVIVPTRGTVQE